MAPPYPRTRRLRVGADLAAVLGPAHVVGALGVGAAVGVGAEVVAQALDQSGRAVLAAVAVVVGGRAGGSGDSDALLDRRGDDPPPGRLPRGDGVAEVGHGEEVDDL